VKGARTFDDLPRGAALEALLHAAPFRERDALVDALFGFEACPPDMPSLPRGAVPYLPAGVDELLAFVHEAPVGVDDVVVDIGAGVGRAAVLVHLLSGAHARGIELQEPLVALARARCAALRLEDVTFVAADACDVMLDGSAYFLYAPCNGAMLARVLERLHDVARRRHIIVGAVGVELPGVEWLRARPTSCMSLTLYDSV
jgi:SAM-dependent methyltransferase